MPCLGVHCCAPAGLLVSSHSKLKRFQKKLLLHFVGVVVHVTSRPLVMVSPPLPLPKLLCQPKPCAAMSEASGSLPTLVAGPAPCVLPKVWPPAISATVSSSSIAMRPNVSRMSLAAAMRVGIAVRAFGVDVDQAHLHRGERILEVARVRRLGVVVRHQHAVVLGTPREPCV